MPLTNSQRLRVLVLDEEVPWPPDSGKRIRTWNLLRRLAQHHDLHLITYGPVSAEARQALHEHRFTVSLVAPLPRSHGLSFYASLFANLFSETPYSVSKHFTARLQDEIAEACHAQEFDLVHIEWGPYARYQTPGLPRVLSAHNVEADIWKRRALHSRTFVGRRFFGLQAARMEDFERRASVHAACVLPVSELDAERFRSYGAREVRVVPNGVDLDYFHARPDVPQADSLVFVGSLDWFPNEDAVRYFVTAILPLVRSNKAINLKIVGRRPSEKLAAALRGAMGVELVGEVPDVRPHLAEARAVVVPLRIGGGTRIKILEALAMEKPVVSTSVGAEGLELQNGRDLLIADTPAEFAAQIERIFADPQQELRLGRNGRAVVEKLYGWDAAAEKLEASWIAAAGRKHSTIAETALTAGEWRL